MSDRERRTRPRRRTLKGGKIIFGDRRSVFDCMVRNLSKTGALLKLPNTIGVPDRFELQVVNEDIQVDAVVRWRTTTELGVQFEQELGD